MEKFDRVREKATVVEITFENKINIDQPEKTFSVQFFFLHFLRKIMTTSLLCTFLECHVIS